jgi:hypothetical protein
VNVLRRSMWVTCFHDYRAIEVVKEVAVVVVLEARLRIGSSRLLLELRAMEPALRIWQDP